MEDTGQITLLLQRIRQGDRGAESELIPIVYDHLHRLAKRQFQSERGGHTLQPTAVISELYLRIIRDTSIDWQSRAHFYRVATETIRRILVDHARKENAVKRPQRGQRVELEDVIAYSDERPYEYLMIDEALTKLKEWDERQAKVVELRFFCGLSYDEMAEIMGVGSRTLKRDWDMARAWLQTLLDGPGDGEEPL
jgi:RNA polymerase sigma factor (TIGR02999 family)